MEPPSIIPGVSLGQLSLGASLHEILNLMKNDAVSYPKIDLHHSQVEPLSTPVVVTLPAQGLRLRFDGADQRLRLIEVTDFRKIKLRHKGSDLVKLREDESESSGPAFRRVYELFGPSYPGEYFAPKDRGQMGTYVLSYPGAAFNFPLQHSAYSKDKDHVAMLGSHAASPATSMALFEGRSWPEARRDLFVRQPLGPRMSAISDPHKVKDNLPAEIEEAHITCDGRVDLIRHGGAGIYTIVLNKTTPQDLTAELGAPDTTHKSEMRDETAHRRSGSTSRPRSNGRATHTVSQPSSFSSTGTDTFETDFEPNDTEEDAFDRASREIFWCYFSHGLDILIGPPTGTTVPPVDHAARTPLFTSPHLVVLKVIIHGNVPGSYAFNRHRRLRWTISLPTDPSNAGADPDLLFSEQHFESDLMPSLLSAFRNTWPETEMSQGKVVNRTWGGGGGGGSSESSFILPGAGEEFEGMSDVSLGGRLGGGDSEQWLGNTRLFAFPGLAFELLENGAVAGLSVG